MEDAVRRAVDSPPPPSTFPAEGGTVNPSPIAIAEEGSQLADPATVAAVSATAREYAACINAGDGARLFALYTEQAVRDNLAFLLSTTINRALAEGTPVAMLQAEAVAGLGPFTTDVATPLVEEARVPDVDVANVRVLADGRVAADIVAAGFPGGNRLLFAEEGDRYLLVGEVATAEPGTPVGAPVA